MSCTHKLLLYYRVVQGTGYRVEVSEYREYLSVPPLPLHVPMLNSVPVHVSVPAPVSVPVPVYVVCASVCTCPAPIPAPAPMYAPVPLPAPLPSPSESTPFPLQAQRPP